MALAVQASYSPLFASASFHTDVHMSTVVVGGGGDPAVNWHPTPGVVEITVRSLETRICNDMMVH